MANLTPLFRDELAKETQSQLYHLISFLDVPVDGTTQDINIVDANEDVTYDSILYMKFPVMFDGITTTGSGEINKATITVANPERVFNQYLKGIRGVRVEVKTVFDKFVDTGESPDVTAHISDEFIVDAYAVNEATLALTLEAVCAFDVRLPRRRYTNLCYFRFREPDTCGYSGVETECDKTLNSCRKRGNQARFGGFPGVLGSARRINF